MLQWQTKMAGDGARNVKGSSSRGILLEECVRPEVRMMRARARITPCCWGTASSEPKTSGDGARNVKGSSSREIPPRGCAHLEIRMMPVGAATTHSCLEMESSELREVGAGARNAKDSSTQKILFRGLALQRVATTAARAVHTGPRWKPRASPSWTSTRV